MAAFTSTVSPTNQLGFVKVDTSATTNSTWIIYAKTTNILVQVGVNIVSKLDFVYISYTATDGKNGILSLNFTTGNVVSIYNLNNSLSNFRVKTHNSVLMGYYTECCDSLLRFYYDFSTNPGAVCFDSKPTGTCFIQKMCLILLKHSTCIEVNITVQSLTDFLYVNEIGSLTSKE